MALFGRKQNTKSTVKEVAEKKKPTASGSSPVPVVKKVVAISAPAGGFQNAQVIKRPRVTEKATVEAEKGVYVFEVVPTATKATITLAVKELYGVNPVKLRIVNLHPKSVVIRGKKGVKSGVKKAYVYLKKGDKIEFV